MAEKKQKRSTAFNAFVSYGLLLFLCVYPAFLPNKYFKMTIGKTIFFCCATAVFALGCLILQPEKNQREKIRLSAENTPGLFGATFLLIAVLSCAASEYRSEAITGATGRYMGLLMLLVIGCAFSFVSRYGRITRNVALIFGASMIFMNAVSLLQYHGYDPFWLYQGTKETVRINFMSLVGNKDVYYSYLALSVPFAMYLAYDAETLAEKIFWHAAELFSFAGVFACNSEGVFIALLPAFLLLFFFRGKDKAGLLCFLRSVMTFIGGALVAALIKPDLTQFGIIETIVTQTLLKPAVCLAALAAAALIYLAVWKLPLPPVFFKALRIVVIVLLAAAAAGGIGAFVYFTFINKTADIGSLTELLRFDSLYWGNKRGYVWSRLLRIFSGFPLHRKLIGAGEETVQILMENAYGDEMMQKTGMVFDNAHNEFLQYLITMGILGLLSYLLFVFAVLKKGVKEGGRFCRAAALCCVCYLAQSFVNISQPITTPLFFVFLALTQTADVSAGSPGNHRTGGASSC